MRLSWPHGRTGSTARNNRPRHRRLITTDLPSPVADATDDDTDPETGPLRRCIVTRERLPKERMIRFVRGPDGRVVPDLLAKLPGRGMWLSASADVLQFNGNDDAATRQLARAFARVAREPVTVPPDLITLLQGALVRRIGELLGLARRAGQAIAGYEKARAVLQAGKATLIVQASDGSAAERARFLSGFGPDMEIIDPLPGEALGRVFGRDYLVHVAVMPGKLADALAQEAGRLAGLRKRSDRTMGPAGAAGQLAIRRQAASVNDGTGANG